MSGPRRFQSIFQQRLDRALFASYFLGAVVPVLVLGWVVDQYVLPGLEGDSSATTAWVGGVVGLGALVLALYFALRRISQETLARMDADNGRLAALLETSQQIVAESQFEAIAAPVKQCARTLTGATGELMLVRKIGPDEEETLAPSERPTPSARATLDGEEGATLMALAESALADKHLVTLASETLSAVALPLVQPGECESVFVLFGSGANPGLGAGEDAGATTDALRTLASLAAVSLEKGALEFAQRNFFTYVTDILTSALDAHVDERTDHASNVARTANGLGRTLGLSPERLGRLHFASLLHDIGMLKIDRSLHRRPEKCRRHTVLGARMLARIRFWEDLAPIVLHHHEYFDGGGYPEGKAGEDIPLESRILAVADAADAMARRGMVPATILIELERHRGTQFDPRVIDAYRALARD